MISENSLENKITNMEKQITELQEQITKLETLLKNNNTYYDDYNINPQSIIKKVCIDT
jgi:chaperonin cofactor prefoldin